MSILKSKILLVDDNKDLGDIIRGILKLSDYIVVEASDNEQAFHLLSNDSFDLVLVDITLPEKKGLRILEFLSAKKIATKVIAITGSKGLEKEIDIAIHGVHDYFVQPYNPNYLLLSIEHVLASGALPHLKLQIIKAGDFLKSTPTGNLDLKASSQILAQIASASDHVQDYSVLIDLRDARSQLSTADIYELATELVKYDETFQRKTAILTHGVNGQEQAKFFETVAQNRGFKVKAFSDFENAISWLSSVVQLPEDTP